MLKLAIREKDSYIQSVEGMMDRYSKIEKRDARKTSHSTKKRMQTEKSS